LDRTRGEALGNGTEFPEEGSGTGASTDPSRLGDEVAVASNCQARASCGYAFKHTDSDIPWNVTSNAREGQMRELIEAIAKALVDNPDQVTVRAVEGEQVTVLELRVHPSDLGKVIGKQGRTARSIRTILNAAGMKLKKRFTLEILE